MHREVAALLTAICIRSLLGCCFSSLLLPAHKGIELSDVQFEVTTRQGTRQIFGCRASE